MQVEYSADGTILLSCKDAQGTVHVQEGCRTIASRAFMYESGLERVELPDTLENIEEFAFACTGLTSFEAPPNLKVIGDKAFFKSGDLTHTSLNEGLRELGLDAFSMTMLEELGIPSSLEKMGRTLALDSPMWWGKVGLMRIDPANEHFLLDEGGAIYQKTPEGYILTGVSVGAMRQHNVLEGTVAIADQAYRGLKVLAQVEMPSGLKSIGAEAFRSCRSLVSVHLPDTLESIGTRAFFDTSLQTLDMPPSLKSIGPEALLTGPNGSRTLKRLNIDEKNERFYVENAVLCERGAAPNGGDLAHGFFGIGGKIVIPKPVTAFAPYAFARCESIDELHVSTHVESVPPSALVTKTFISHIVFELDEPLCGSNHLDLLFTPSRGVRLTLGLALDKHGLDTKALSRLSDQAAVSMRDVFKRSSWILSRLTLPQLLDEDMRDIFIQRLERDVLPACELFAQHGYLEGFKMLEKHGFLNKENIQDAVEAVVAVGDAAPIAHMLAIRNRLGVTREAMTI